MLKKLYENVEEYACVFFVGLMIACLAIQVGIRMVLGSALAWTEELSRYSFLWAVYMAAALAVKRGAHVRISAQLGLMGLKGRLLFLRTADAIWIGVNLFFFYNSVGMIQDGLQFKEISPTLGLVKAWVEMIIPFSFLLMSWRIVERHYRHWKNGTQAQLVFFEGDQV